MEGDLSRQAVFGGEGNREKIYQSGGISNSNLAVLLRRDSAFVDANQAVRATGMGWRDDSEVDVGTVGFSVKDNLGNDALGVYIGVVTHVEQGRGSKTSLRVGSTVGVRIQVEVDTARQLLERELKKTEEKIKAS